MMDKFKGAFRSWTIRFNALMMVLMEILPMAQESLPQLQPYIPENTFHLGMTVLIVGNMLLRFRTNTCLSER